MECGLGGSMSSQLRNFPFVHGSPRVAATSVQHVEERIHVQVRLEVDDRPERKSPRSDPSEVLTRSRKYYLRTLVVLEGSSVAEDQSVSAWQESVRLLEEKLDNLLSKNTLFFADLSQCHTSKS